MNTYTTNTGQLILNVHDENKDCKFGCTIHHPSNHHMKNWPLNYRNDRGMMERICKHGVGHPDPDYLAYIEREGWDLEAYSTHGCDGCCREESNEKE